MDVARQKNIDVVRGILIIFVVLGHYKSGNMHDLLFLFHMPLFFILSGYLLKKENVKDIKYLKKKIKSFILPYYLYMVLDFIILKRNISINSFIHMLWGGRSIPGVYWYITSYLFAILLLAILLRFFSDKKVKYIIFSIGGVAVIESNLYECVEWLQTPGIPLNLDVSFLALVYIAMGFFYRERIFKWLNSESRKYNMAALGIVFSLGVFGVINSMEKIYYFDMKYVYYKEYISALIIPVAFGFVLLRCVHFFMRDMIIFAYIRSFLEMCGKSTIPIMFLHMMLNNYFDQNRRYGIIIYLLLGIVIPLMINMTLGHIKICQQLLGLQMIKYKGKYKNGIDI